MAMEVTSSKQLLKHTLPVLMIITMLFVISVVTLSRQSAPGFNQAQHSALAKGLVTRIFRVKPTADGLAKISLNNSAAAQDVTTDANLPDGLSQTGSVARLSFEL